MVSSTSYAQRGKNSVTTREESQHLGNEEKKTSQLRKSKKRCILKG